MPADDLILNVKQIAGYPAALSALPTDAVILQRGGLGGPYMTIAPGLLVGTALSQGGDMFINGTLNVAALIGSSAQIANAAVNALSSNDAIFRTMEASWGSINGLPIATQNYVDTSVAALGAATVHSFNGRVGDVRLWLSDVLAAGAAPIWSPFLQGTPMAPTPSLRSNSERIATTAWARRNADDAINCLLETHPFVFSFNGRSGDVVLTAADLEGAEAAILDSPAFVGTPTAPTAPPLTNNSQLATTAYVDSAVAASSSSILGQVSATYAPINSPAFQGTPVALTAAPGTSTGQLATTAFVMAAVADSVAGVATWNGRSGNVALEAIDVQDVGGALVNSPNFTGVPTAPTAALGVNTNQVATCAFVINELGGATVGVMSFNGRGGAVVLNETDIENAGGAPADSPALSGVPTAPTAASGVSTNQLATTAYVMAALTTNAGVTSFMGRTGAITLTYADISAAGGLANPSPALTGTPTAPTAPTATNTGQIATTAFVYAAIAAGAVNTFNGRSGAVTLTQADIVAAGGALLASPAFSGTPSAPTAAQTVNTTQIATTAFVTAKVASYLALSGGTLTGPLVMPTAQITNGSLEILPGSAVNASIYLFDSTQVRSAFFFNIATGQTSILDYYSSVNITLGPANSMTLNASTVVCANGLTVAGALTIAGGGQLSGSNGQIVSSAQFLAPSFQFTGTFASGLINNSGQPVTGDIANLAIIANGSSPTGLALQSTNAIGSVAYYIWVDSGSDARIKNNVAPTDVDALGLILAIPVRQFDFDPAASAALRHSPTPRVASFHVPIGLVAQEVGAFIPEMDFIAAQPEGHDPALPTDLHAIALPNCIPHLIRAIQQLEARVRQLETRTLQ